APAHGAERTRPVACRYKGRRDVVIEEFRSLGWDAAPTPATMFVWLPVPAGFDSQGWTRHLIDVADVVVTPGNAFGPGGEGFFRVSLSHRLTSFARRSPGCGGPVCASRDPDP